MIGRAEAFAPFLYVPLQPRGRAVCLPTRGHFRPRLRRDRAVMFDKRGVNPL